MIAPDSTSMTSVNQPSSGNGSVAPATHPQDGDAANFEPRVLFLCAAEPDVASGTPVILCDLLTHFPDSDAEVLCEHKFHVSQRRNITLRHRVRTIYFPNLLWPFRRGSRVRDLLVYVGLPWLILVGWWRILRFRPTCLVAIYYRIPWIIAAYVLSRTTRVPLIIYVHDTVRENFDGSSGLKKHFVAWLEEKVLRGSTVMVLHPYLADHYRQRYGIHCTILRQIVWRELLPDLPEKNDRVPLTIGFAGAIYDNNARQLTELAAIVQAAPRLRLKIWTAAPVDRLNEMGIRGERIDVGFENNYERLLQCLAGCDLLYLPLAFDDSGSLTANALQYAFPTKSLDYLLAGPPILVHCPKNYELSRFFSVHACAQVLNEGEPAALQGWIDAWLAGQLAAPDAAARGRAVEVFSPQENRRLFWEVMSEVSTVSRNKTSAKTQLAQS